MVVINVPKPDESQLIFEMDSENKDCHEIDICCVMVNEADGAAIKVKVFWIGYGRP